MNWKKAKKKRKKNEKEKKEWIKGARVTMVGERKTALLVHDSLTAGIKSNTRKRYLLKPLFMIHTLDSNAKRIFFLGP